MFPLIYAVSTVCEHPSYCLNCISVVLCTQSVYFVWAGVMGVNSLTVSVSTGHTVWGIYYFKRHVHNFVLCNSLIVTYIILTVFVLKSFLLFKSSHPNLVCSKSGIRRTRGFHRHILPSLQPVLCWTTRLALQLSAHTISLEVRPAFLSKRYQHLGQLWNNGRNKAIWSVWF